MKKNILFAALSTLMLTSGCVTIPEACFSVDKTQTFKINEEVKFSGGCSENAASYSWDFGDGTAVATGMDVTHKYTVAGTYPVKLTVTSKNKTSVASQNILIQ